MRITVRYRAAIAGIVAVGLALAGCGGDDGDDGGAGAPTTETTVGGGGLGGDPVTPVSGADICAGLSASAVADATGLDVSDGEADDDATPQCTYTYATTEGSTSTLTVASMRDSDIGGRTGDDAFDFVLDVNRGLGAETDFDEVELDVGDRAVRFTGEVLHLGVVAAGGHLFTVIVPVGDVDAGMVDGLVAVIADQLG